MVAPANQQLAGGRLLLEMAFQAEHLIPSGKHALVYRAMWFMARVAALAKRLMLEHKRAPLTRVTLETGLILPHDTGAPTLDCRSLVWIVAVGATNLAFGYGVMVWQAEFALDVLMALEAGRWRFPGIDDRVRGPAGADVDAAWAMAGFATDVFRMRSLCHHPGMVGCLEIASDRFMALRAACSPRERRARNVRRRNYRV
jgi:hypothetical protein